MSNETEVGLTVEDIAEQLKIHWPGAAFHADNKTHAELIANRFMDFTAHLLTELATIERDTAKKVVEIQSAMLNGKHDDLLQGIDAVSDHFNLGAAP